MSGIPSEAELTALAQRVLAAEGAPEQGDLEIALSDEPAPHPRLPGREHVYAVITERRLRLHTASFAALAAAHPGLDIAEEVEAHVATALEDDAAAAETLATPEDEDSLLARHARFRRGEELPYAWYRGGERLDTGVWAVDLDVFVEVWISRHTWPALVAGTLTLELGEDELEIDLPEDADPSDLLTLEGAGLLDDEPYEDEPLPPSGDLHVLFVPV